MRAFKWIVVVFLALIVAFMVFSSTQPDMLIIKESTIIDAPRDRVFDEVSNFKKWKNWHLWFELDSNIKSIYSEKMQQVGSSYEWISENPMVDNGIQTTIEYEANKFIKNEIIYYGWDAKSYQSFNVIDTNNNQTYLVWTYEGAKTPFYYNFMNTFMEPMLRKNYKKGLRGLKKYMEQLPKKEVQEVRNPRRLEIEAFEPIKIASIVDSTTADHVGKKLTELFTEITIFLEMDDAVEADSIQLAIYHEYSTDKVILEAAIPYAGETTSSDRIQLKTLSSDKVIKGAHYGDCSDSEKLHFAIIEYADAKGLEIIASPWEIYTNGPVKTDTTESKTYVYYPVK
jgi:effector-binding domain-containing protein